MPSVPLTAGSMRSVLGLVEVKVQGEAVWMTREREEAWVCMMESKAEGAAMSGTRAIMRRLEAMWEGWDDWMGVALEGERTVVIIVWGVVVRRLERMWEAM